MITIPFYNIKNIMKAEKLMIIIKNMLSSFKTLYLY